MQIYLAGICNNIQLKIIAKKESMHIINFVCATYLVEKLSNMKQGLKVSITVIEITIWWSEKHES